MIRSINDSKTLRKHVSYECKCRFYGEKNVIKTYSKITINVDVSVKKFMYVKNIIFGILLHVIVKIENI